MKKNKTNRVINQNIKTAKDPIDSVLASQDELSKDQYPLLQSLSAAFIFSCLPISNSSERPEYIYIDFRNIQPDEINDPRLLIPEWNLAWESGEYRYDMFQDRIPEQLSWLDRFSDKNIYLVPKYSQHKYTCYVPLFHLLPKHVLEYNGLPLLKKGQWPPSVFGHTLDMALPMDFNDRLAQAFAYYIWPYLESGSKITSFSNNDSIKLLAHNLDYWLPHIYSLAETRLKSFGRTTITDQKQQDAIVQLRNSNPNIKVERPLMGGMLWYGEHEANLAAKDLIELADKNGNLRNIIEAIKSNRVEDDFSDRWSYAKEDFERKLYKKRTKYKVTFVELTDTIPIQGPETEINENQCWEDFISILDPKEKRIVVCIRDGYTKVGEISQILGYANHSPVSKALKKIRNKALDFIDNS